MQGWFALFASEKEIYLCKDDSISWLSRYLHSCEADREATSIMLQMQKAGHVPCSFDTLSVYSGNWNALEDGGVEPSTLIRSQQSMSKNISNFLIWNMARITHRFSAVPIPFYIALMLSHCLPVFY
jgi:hypothetical protein